MPAKHIFKGTNFALSGKLSQTHDVIADTIRKLGGEVSSAVNGNTDYLITTEEDVKAKKLKVATAQALNTEVLKESFLFECQAARSLLPLRKFRFKAVEQKRPAPRAKDGAAAASAAPAKVRKVAKVIKKGLAFEIAADVPVIAKSGRADTYGVVQQSITKGHVNGSIVWDVELVLNDPAVGKDKYYCIQLVAPKRGAGPAGYYVIYRWGKTGSSGTCTSDGPFESFQAARPSFLRRFKQKTGNVWGHLGEAFLDVEGKYRVVAKDDVKEVGEFCWQYYLHNEVDGKKIGWYDYDAAAAENMEKFWRQYNSNEGLAVRIIRSYFKYEVNFGDMIQKNTSSGMRRAIRRLGPGEKPSREPPAVIPERHKPEEKKRKEEGEEAEDSSADEEEFEDPGDEEEELEEGEEEEDEEADAEMEDVAKAAPAAAAEIAGDRAAPGADPSPPTAPGGGREAEKAGEAELAGQGSAGPASTEGGRAPPPAGNDEAEAVPAEDAPSEAETVVAADLPLRVGDARKAC